MFISVLISTECGVQLAIWGRSGKGENAKKEKHLAAKKIVGLQKTVKKF